MINNNNKHLALKHCCKECSVQLLSVYVFIDKTTSLPGQTGATGGTGGTGATGGVAISVMVETWGEAAMAILDNEPDNNWGSNNGSYSDY